MTTVQPLNDDLQYGIKAISLGSPLYPANLAQIKNPPNILYARGNFELLKQCPGVAVVGARNATDKGLKITARITEYVVEQGAIVVSGLALGIDAKAHASCLAAKGKTIAVLAHGLHMAQPHQNTKLAEQILENDGLWVSEYPTGTPASRNHFVPRNRIQVGLSACSIVIESASKSGTTTHARFCVQEHHPLFAVIPQEGNPLGLNSEGPIMMVKEMGATGLQSKDDYSKLAEAIFAHDP